MSQRSWTPSSEIDVPKLVDDDIASAASAVEEDNMAATSASAAEENIVTCGIDYESM
jgi:hypothetical protein